MSDTCYFSAIDAKERIDGGSGVIYGVSVLTIGKAKGHDEWIDSKTLSQFQKVATTFRDGIKVKLSQSREHDGSAGQIVGKLSSFRIDGSQVRADLHLVKSSGQFDFILELAQTMPTEFGLSIVVPMQVEDIGGKNCLRIEDIYSVDLVEAPAANHKGLFSSKTNENTMKDIKYAKGDSGEHAKDCECKECMSKHSKKEMSAFVAGLVGLSADASEDDIKAKLAAIQKPVEPPKKEEPKVAPEIAALTAKIDGMATELTAFKAGNANQAALAQKAEIDALVAEAARDGKQIPLDADDIYVVEKGLCTVKIAPAQLSKMISKLAKGAVPTSQRKPVEMPKTKTGLAAKRGTVEFADWARQKREEGEAALSAKFATISGLN